MHSKKKLLVAETREAVETVRAALEQDFELAFALTLSDAKVSFDRQIDMVLCGVHFDESRLFELLQLIRAGSEKPVPVVVLHALESTLPDALAEVVRTATEATGCEGFVDLTRWRLELGDDAAFQKFRALLQAL